MVKVTVTCLRGWVGGGGGVLDDVLLLKNKKINFLIKNKIKKLKLRLKSKIKICCARNRKSFRHMDTGIALLDVYIYY